jgi:hypothetical protein
MSPCCRGKKHNVTVHRCIKTGVANFAQNEKTSVLRNNVSICIKTFRERSLLVRRPFCWNCLDRNKILGPSLCLFVKIMGCTWYLHCCCSNCLWNIAVRGLTLRSPGGEYRFLPLFAEIDGLWCDTSLVQRLRRHLWMCERCSLLDWLGTRRGF